MCAAQLSKIVCYNRELPYLAIIPTVLLSAGMLMFFTLGSSMVGDICDEDELRTGTRSEGSFYAVYWWFIKMGSAFASFVTGALLIFTTFDERQNVMVDALRADIAAVNAEAESGTASASDTAARTAKLGDQVNTILKDAEKLRSHFEDRLKQFPEEQVHMSDLLQQVEAIQSGAETLRTDRTTLAESREEVGRQASALLDHAAQLKKQTTTTLFRLRFVEIGLPIVLSCISLLLTLRYPLTEARWRQIKEALSERHAHATA
jgi:glycoside/pentoside/hexuronide:cation symporter, GPH family